MATRVLEIGANIHPKAKAIYKDTPDLEVVILDADEKFKPDIVADILTMPDIGQFDGIVISHVLEHVPYRMVADVLNWLHRSLVDGGQIHVIVPSLEWAAREILAESPSPALLGHLYAGQTTPWDIHLSGFTMRLLRLYLDKTGFSVIRAQTQKYVLIAHNGKECEAHEHYAIGVKGTPPLRKE